MTYSNTLFTGVIFIWMFNTLASIVRGTGDMRTPSITVITVACLQIVIGGCLSLGLGAFPRLGIAGVAIGQVAAFAAGSLFLLLLLRTDQARIQLRFSGLTLERGMFFDILKVGAISCLSPLQSVLTVLILSAFVARLGTETLAGYGIGVRLEFLLVPIAFAIGVASVPMVGWPSVPATSPERGASPGRPVAYRQSSWAWWARWRSFIPIYGHGCSPATRK